MRCQLEKSAVSPYDDVLVPLDGSRLAEGILPYVEALVQGRASTVHLLSVASTGRGARWPFADRQRDQETRDHVERELRVYLQGAAGELALPLADVQLHVRFGRPADEILAFAHEIDAGAIVTSTHGRSGIGRWGFGSVTDRVLRGATCPVLLVRPRAGGEAGARPDYRRILVPLDGSEIAEQVLPYVRALIQPQQTRIDLISVLVTGLGDQTVALLTSYPPGLRLASTTRHYAEIKLQAYLRSVAAALRERGAIVHLSVRQGLPADEILAFGCEIKADLIAMTTHGLSGFSRWTYGNVASKVLQGASSPVLLVRPSPEKASTTPNNDEQR